MVARVAVEEGEQEATSHRVDDLVDAWEREGVLWAMFIEINIIHTNSIHYYSFSRLVQG
jgi:hypothetical protein